MKSKGEESFAILLKSRSIPFVREYQFAKPRRWRFDFVLGSDPTKNKIAIEIEGGVYRAGRHTRGSGYEKDLEKYNAAIEHGWKVLRYSTGMVNGFAIDQTAKVWEKQLLSKSDS